MIRKLLIAIAFTLILINLHQNNAYASVSDWQKGVSIQPTSADDFGSASFRKSVDNALATGINYITLIIPVHQDNIHSNAVYPGSDTPTNQSLISASNYITSKKASVAYAVHINTYDGQWRAMIEASNRPQWFASYTSLLRGYAQLAQANNVSQIILGTELTGMTNPNIDASNTKNWVDLIASVRTVYSGSLTYSAQRSGYRSDAQELGFWPQLDKIGISAYYELGSNNYPSVDELKQRWQRWNDEEINVLAKKYNKPVIFTEVGYVSRDNSLNAPGLGYDLYTPINQNVQAKAYQALFEYWNNYSYMQGVNLWDWLSNPNGGGANSGEYTPQNKQAQQVMTDWFNRSSTPTTPTAKLEIKSSASYSSTANTINAAITSTQDVNDVIVDVEVYDANNKQIKQQFYEHQNLTAAQVANYSFAYTPSNSGDYTIRVGVFTNGWSSNYDWNAAAGKFTSQPATPAPAPTPTQPSTPPASTAPSTPTAPTPAPTTQSPPATTTPSNPTTPAPSSQSANISIWWPGSTQKVNGVQPFKAVVDNMKLEDYKMYWQVDGDKLNEMNSINDQAPHKQSDVDLSGWNWKSSKQYTINFVAKKNDGTVIAQKAVTITLY